MSDENARGSEIPSVTMQEFGTRTKPQAISFDPLCLLAAELMILWWLLRGEIRALTPCAS